MVKLLIIALFFSAVCKGQFIGFFPNGQEPPPPTPSVTPRIFDTLIQNGTFYPATTLTP